MRILITNDDGINAPGLAVLQKLAATLAGPDGEVWCVAPAFEQSGVGHCISYAHPTLMAQMGERLFALEGSPADCVLAGIHDVLEGEKPDLLLSGVNRGNNSAENALYSGTLGGAMEGALQGVCSIALSQYFGAGNRDLDDPFEATAQHGVSVIERILGADPEFSEGYRRFYNVNFPPVAAKAVQGVSVAPQGRRVDTVFRMEPQISPTGRRFLWARGGDQTVDAGVGSDAAQNLAGYISVTPMRADLTDHSALTSLQDHFK